MPIFHLMALAMNLDGFKLLEGLCREFIWGPGENGNPRVPLVSWDTIAQLAAVGGLSFTRFKEHAALLKMRCVTAHTRSQHGLGVDGKHLDQGLT